MKTTIQYRLTENDALVGEGALPTFDPPEPQLVPEVGDIFLLHPSLEGRGKVIAIEDVVKVEPTGTDEARVITIRFERCI